MPPRSARPATSASTSTTCRSAPRGAPRGASCSRLLDLFDSCRYPLLIHCKSGADRTGLASGLYLMARRGVPPGEALRAFSVLHGHFPIGGPEHLHEPIEEYAAWLRTGAWPTPLPCSAPGWNTSTGAYDEARHL